MTKSPNAACVAGDSLLNEAFRSLCQRLDYPHSDGFAYDELHEWLPPVVDWVLQRGFLREIEPARELMLWECERQDCVEPFWDIDRQTGKRIGKYCCGDDNCAGMHFIDPERMRQWKISFEGLARIVAKAIGCAGTPAADVPERVWFLGSLTREGIFREVFLAHGLRWSDAAHMLSSAERLKASQAPAILVPMRLPGIQLWESLKPATGVLTELGKIVDGSLVAVIDSLFAQQCVPHAQSGSPQWLTVTDAAELLMKDLPGLGLIQAKARVSTAASRGNFVTNGRKREERRIDHGTFSAWRLTQRDRDLDSED